MAWSKPAILEAPVRTLRPYKALKAWPGTGQAMTVPPLEGRAGPGQELQRRAARPWAGRERQGQSHHRRRLRKPAQRATPEQPNQVKKHER